MRTKDLIIFLIIGLFFISGVAGCPKTGTESTTSTGVFAGGSEGLNIAFVNDEPPNEVFNKEPFYISLDLTNIGEYDIPNNKVIATLAGINAESFGLKSLNTILNLGLEGKQKTEVGIIEGLKETLSFGELKHKYDLDVNFITNIYTDVCYQYQTRGESKLCLKQKTDKTDKEDACAVTNQNVPIDNSGAPIQIKDVKQVASGTNEVKITFTIENVGEGEVYPPDAFTSACKRDATNLDKLKVEVGTKSGIPIKCGRLDNTNKGVVKLSGKATTIVCSVDTYRIQESAFEEPFDIKLTYFYKEGISKQITVKA